MSASKPTLLDNALQSIINELAWGTAPWRKPWKVGRPSLPLRSTGEAFSGMNAILLSTIQIAHGYASPYWLTYNQAVAQGASVRRGERGSPAILYKVKVVDGGEGAGGSDDSDGREGDGDRVLRFLKSYAVFNAAQIDGLPDIFYPEATSGDNRSFEPLSPAVVSIMAHFPTPVVVGGDRASYVPAADRIHMPQRISFDSDADYVATLFHEYAHATGHRSRLDRFRPGTTTEDYAREELVAELTSHLVSLHLGLAPSETVFRNHVAYLASWAGILRDRPGELLKAAGKAQAACEFILSVSAEASGSALAVAA